MNAVGFVRLRHRLNLTQETLAERMGLSARAIQDIERRDGNVREVHALAISMLSIMRAIEEGDPTYVDDRLLWDIRVLVQR